MRKASERISPRVRGRNPPGPRGVPGGGGGGGGVGPPGTSLMVPSLVFDLVRSWSSLVALAEPVPPSSRTGSHAPIVPAGNHDRGRSPAFGQHPPRGPGGGPARLQHALPGGRGAPADAAVDPHHRPVGVGQRRDRPALGVARRPPYLPAARR